MMPYLYHDERDMLVTISVFFSDYYQSRCISSVDVSISIPFSLKISLNCEHLMTFLLTSFHNLKP